MAEITAEITAYDGLRADLEANHLGKWVLVHDLKLVCIFDTFEQTAERAVHDFGAGPYLIRQVGAPPMTLPASVMYQRGGRANDQVRV